MIGFGVNFRLMAILRKITEVRPQLPFRNHIGSDLETRRSPSALNEGFRAAGKPREDAVFGAGPACLSVRLISL
jgi:hypothetical protein